MIRNGLTGETSSTSIVPDSFSRTIETEVIMAQTRMKISPMIPGTKLKALFIRGLNSMRVSKSVCGEASPSSTPCSQAAAVPAVLTFEASRISWIRGCCGVPAAACSRRRS